MYPVKREVKNVRDETRKAIEGKFDYYLRCSRYIEPIFGRNAKE